MRPLLERRFAMQRWFMQHGYPASIWADPATAATAAAAAAAPATAPATAAAEPPGSGLPSPEQPVVRAQRDVLLLCDFDGALTGFDTGAWAGGRAESVCLPANQLINQPTSPTNQVQHPPSHT